MSFKDNQLILRCLNCNKNYNKDFNKELINIFSSTYEFCNKDINKFILLLRKGVPYGYMDSWERFDETSLSDKEAFYSSLTMENITEVDYRHAKKVFNKIALMICMFKVTHYCLLMYLKILETNVLKYMNYKYMKYMNCSFLSAPGLAWQACLKKTEVELELLTDVDILLMVEKGIRDGIYHAIHRYAKANNKYMNDYNEDEEESFL